jgi:hypothetical protein
MGLQVQGPRECDRGGHDQQRRRQPALEREVRKAVTVGDERTFEQDPALALCPPPSGDELA